jgi:hypothetical protein
LSGKGFAQFGMGATGEVAVHEGKGGAAQARQIGDQVGFATTRVIFAPEGIPAPMVAVFDPAPVIADEGDPVGDERPPSGLRPNPRLIFRFSKKSAKRAVRCVFWVDNIL